jgi:hypothetical protein
MAGACGAIWLVGDDTRVAGGEVGGVRVDPLKDAALDRPA